MRNPLFTAAGFTLALTTVSCSSLHQNAVKQAADAAGVDSIKSIEFSGTGRWYQFGQAPSPELPWPPFAVKSYTADINYETASARVQISRLQEIGAGRNRPVPTEQKVDQYINGNVAGIWRRRRPTPVRQRSRRNRRQAQNARRKFGARHKAFYVRRKLIKPNRRPRREHRSQLYSGRQIPLCRYAECRTPTDQCQNLDR